MLSVQAQNMNGSPIIASTETTHRSPAHRPASLAVPLPSAGVPSSPRFGTPISGRPASEILGSARLPTREVESLDQWFENFQTYEATLEAMAAASVDPKFSEELSTIEHWFKILSEPERTATLYTLLQHSSQIQIRFLIAVLQQMLKSDANPPPTASLDGQMRVKSGNRNARPPSLNLPAPDSPAVMNLPSALESATLRSADAKLSSAQSEQMPLPSTAQTQDLMLPDEASWASMVKTPSTPMFNNTGPKAKRPMPELNAGMNQFPGFAQPGMGLPNLAGNPYSMGMLGQMGISAEAQILAMQMMMNGGFMPGAQIPMPQPQTQNQRGAQGQRQPSRNGGTNWRAPGSGRYPGSALRSAGLKSAGIKSAGLKSGGLKSSGLASAASTGSTGTPREEDFDPELLNDIPAWLKLFRLHKYTDCFAGLTWQEIVALDDAALEAKGVTTLGARRRLLRTFEMVRHKMGMEPSTAEGTADAATPTGAEGVAPEKANTPETPQPTPAPAETAPISAA
ncbi:hypothetical protein HGRIS_002361 [Hohenbuehelia grisea]|uniref:SAM domain-containing protein n=1 Tax=Hohenbuehelia grisea TaxID=104357 RepID=A0ABR3JK95_9AGAR